MTMKKISSEKRAELVKAVEEGLYTLEIGEDKYFISLDNCKTETFYNLLLNQFQGDKGEVDDFIYDTLIEILSNEYGYEDVDSSSSLGDPVYIFNRSQYYVKVCPQTYGVYELHVQIHYHWQTR